jgi:hypothetical protein
MEKKRETIQLLKKMTNTVPDKFIEEYVDLTHQRWVDLDVAVEWLGASKSVMVRRLKSSSYKEGKDYVIVKRGVYFVTPTALKDAVMSSRCLKCDLIRTYFVEIGNAFHKHLGSIIKAVEKMERHTQKRLR